MKHHLLIIISAVLICTHSKGSETTNQPPSSYRLPETVRPNKYIISLTPDLVNHKQSTFQGTVEIEFQTTAENVKSITLHSKNHTIGLITLTSKNQMNIEETYRILNITTDELRDFMIFHLEQPLEIGKTYFLKAEYSGSLNNDMKGFYKSSYTNAANQTIWIAATQHQATHARRTFPCFDEPNFKATFQLSITRPKRFNATLGNTLKSSIPINEFSFDIFVETPKISTYLLAFVVTDFHTINNRSEQFGVYTRDTTIKQAEYAYSIGNPLLDVLENYTNTPFNYKVDLVAIPDFSAGAMENWGLVTFRENALLYDPQESTKRNKQRVATVVAHELSHMWFGDMVTFDWWDYAWLNEGFARFFQYKAVEHIYPEWEMEDQFVIDQLQNIFETDSYLTANPLNRKVFTTVEIASMFDPITYNKGASIIRMIEHMLGETTFRNALQTYLDKNKFKNVKPDHLYQALQEHADKDNKKINITDAITTWTEKSGYPYITVTWTGSNETVIVSQNRFLYNGKETNKTYWNIPLTYTFAESPRLEIYKSWLPANSTNQTIKIQGSQNKWIIFNLQETGYYRVNYCQTLWSRLINYLTNNTNLNQISKIDRAQIVDNVLNFARAGIVTYNTAFDVVYYLQNETNYFPWASAFNGFSFINRRLESDNVASPLFQTHIKMLMKNLYKKSGFEEQNNDTHIDTLSRINAVYWACQFGEKDCVENSKKMFESWMVSNGKIPASFRSVVYCTALRNGNGTHWNYLWHQYLHINIPSEQATILIALGCTTNETILNSYLQKSIEDNSGIRKQDSDLVFKSVYSGSPTGVTVAFKFLKKYYLNITKSYGGENALANCINGLASHLTTKQEIEEFERFLKSIKDEIPEIAVSSEIAIERAKTDFHWNEQYRDVIVKILKKQNSAPSLSQNNILMVLIVLILYVANV